MSPVFIIFCILAFLGAVGYGVYYKYKADSLKSEAEAMRQATQKQSEDTITTESENCGAESMQSENLGDESTQGENAGDESSQGDTSENDSARGSDAVAFMEEMGKRHQFKLEELSRDEDWVIYYFSFQNGNFVCRAATKAPIIQLEFRGVAGLPFSPENIEKIRELCQRLNNDYLFAKIVYGYDEKANELDIHVQIETIEPTESAFMMYIRTCFKMGNVVRQELEKGAADTEVRALQNQRDYRMLVDAEMAHEAEEHKENHPASQAPNHGSVGEYVGYLFGNEAVEDMLSLTVQNVAGTTTIRQRDEIARYDLLSAAIDTSGEEARFVDNKEFSSSVLTINTVRNHYVFTLHPLEDKKELLSVRMTAVRTPHEFVQDYVPEATYVPEAVSMLLCYVKTQLPETESEEPVELPKTNIGKQIRHGHLLMEQRCFLQAIAVLTPIFKKWKTNVFNANEKEKNGFLQVAYYIGFCYTELHIYDKAYYYLELVHRSGNRFDYSSEYINCLANSSDPRVFYAIDEEQKATEQEIRKIDADEDSGTEQMTERRQQFVSYALFLQRRKGYAQINFGYLDAAEETFKGLLDIDECHDYAQNELDYIARLRLQEMEKRKNNTKESDRS